MYKKLKNIITWIRRFRLDDTTYLLKKADVLVLCSDADRQSSMNGKLFSEYTDSIVKDLIDRGFTVLSVAHPFAQNVGTACFNEPISINRKYLFNTILLKFTNCFLFKFLLIEDIYTKILNRVQPKIIFTIDSPIRLVKAARNLNIHMIEVAHGIGYIKLVWGWTYRSEMQLPNEILVYDEISAKTFSGLSNLKVTKVAHPIKRKYSRLKFQKKTYSIKNILIPLSWGYDGDHGEYIEQKNILKNGLLPEELITLFGKSTDFKWNIRLHPVHMANKSFYKRHFRLLDYLADTYEHIEYKKTSCDNLEDVLAYTDAVVSMQSMIVYDAAYCGIKSLVLCPNTLPGGVNKAFAEDLVRTGMVTKAHSDEAYLENWLNNAHRVEPEIIETEINDYITFLETIGNRLTPSRRNI